LEIKHLQLTLTLHY